MNRTGKLLRTALPITATTLLVGCGGGDSGGAPGAAAVTEMPFDLATSGNVTGSVTFEGTPPPPVEINMSSEPSCAARYPGTPVREVVRVQGDGQLGDVFVYVKSGLEGMQFPVPQEATLIDQLGCQYDPHISGVMTNQTLTFRNSDGLLHNVNATPTVNRPFNFGQPVNMDTNRTLTEQEIMVPVRCDVHGWMLAYVGVVPHPYHAVSNNGGTFDLQNLPPGEYVVEAWHAALGTQEQTVTVATGQTATVSFTFTEAMLASAVVPLGEPLDPHDHSPMQRLVELLSGTGHHDHPAMVTALR